jgi:hypothetical protein
LFAGYLYAHVSQRLRPRHQYLLQLAIVAAAAMALKCVLPDASWQPRAVGEPVWQILLILAATVGLPFFVLSTTAPLIQAWYVRRFPESVPYRLYALSNLASLTALLTYPFIFERVFDLTQQARIWSWAFWAYAVLCGIVVVNLWRHESESDGGMFTDASPNGDGPGQLDRCDSPTRGQRALWLLLPALATIALLATTDHVCTDIAVMPFLWVVPLALYLLTFIIAFGHPRWYRPVLIAAVTLPAIYGAALVNRTGLGNVEFDELGTTGRCLRMARQAFAEWWSDGPLTAPLESLEFHIGFPAFLALNFAAMFGVCLLCHGELCRRRPHSRHLTSFYLLVAAGGVIGGAAVSLVAPYFFRTYVEWRLVMFAGCIVALTIILHHLIQSAFPSDVRVVSHRRSGLIPLLSLCVLLLPAALVLIDLVEYMAISDRGVLFRERNFFGALAICERNADDPRMRTLVLLHGSTAHGAQFTDSSRRGQPTTYYSTVGGIGRTLNFYHSKPPSGGLRIGAVGLGTATLAAYTAPGDSISFYEINPAVVSIAENEQWFTYLHDCRQRGGKYDIKLGDARLMLERELGAGGRRRFHVLVLDAFSGDAIPVHLLTEEAFEVYLQHLSTSNRGGEDGAVAVHISNRYLDLEPVVRGAAQRFGLQCAYVHNKRNPKQFIYDAEWIILTRSEELLAALAPFTVPSEETTGLPILWTDARSSLLDVLK